MRAFCLGVVTVVMSGLCLVYGAAVMGMIPANSDAAPSALERWFARTALNATIRRQAPKQENPLAPTDTNLIAGIRLYKQNCAVCHGGATAGPTKIARGLYQRPPQLRKNGVEDDPAGITYWKVAHGIRLTGMPAFSKTLSEKQVWQVTLFLQRMDRISPAAQGVWKQS
jgi:thiosulfate dehydrogenase